MEVRPDAYAPAAEKLGVPVERLLEHCRGMVERKLLRRVAAILFHRRAGFLGQRHGRLEGARGADRGARPPDGRRARRLALLPAPDLSRLAVQRLHDGARPLEGGVRRGARRRRGESPGSGVDDRSTLYSSTEFKKIRLHYFTPDYAEWEAQARLSRDAPQRDARAPRSCSSARRRLMPGRREQPGARDARRRPRSALHRARRGRGARRRRRQPLRRLRLLVGPADPRPRAPGRRRRRSTAAAERGTSYGAPTEAEVELAERGRRARALRRDGAPDLVGHRGGDDGAAPRALGDRPRARCSSSPAPTTATSTGCWPTPARGSRRRGSRPRPA